LWDSTAVRVTYATGQGSGESNEDTVATAGDVVVVLDGVSQWHTKESGCVHGTGWYVRRLAESVLHHAAQDVPLTTAVAEAINDVAKAHDTCDLDHPWTPAATAVVLRETPTAVEYLVLCDCTLVVETDHGTLAITDTRLAELLRWVRSSPERRDHLTDGLTRLRNRDGGYWVASTDPTAAYNAITGCLPKSILRRAVLLTDGASCLVDDYAQASWDDIPALAPDELIARVRHWERTDPEKRRWPRGKVHDDATAAHVTFRL
jgi:hypothetical protein